MSAPLIWPTKRFFYPIGNTPAVCLTQDLPPGQSADVLLLGCGDVRNVLYTVYADLPSPAGPRKLDFTCCDYQPALLARNILLYVLVVENQPIDKIWNIYYHFFVDKASLAVLVRYCDTLLACSQTVEEWHQSKFGSWLRVLDRNTLAEIRQCWQSYASLHPIDPGKNARLRKEFKEVSAKNGSRSCVGAARSAGPLMAAALTVMSDLFDRFWKSGTTFLSEREIRTSAMINPTFVYALHGERFEPHYGTFPLQSFHLAGAFVPDGRISAPIGSKERVVQVAREQFSAWCHRFREIANLGGSPSVVVRFYAGDALAFCNGLSHCARTRDAHSPIYSGPWRSRPIVLDQLICTGAPTSFDTIDTSNLTDHIGLLNILLAAEPLVNESSSVLYTETLLPLGTNAARSFIDRICGDPQVMGVLIGLVPRPLLTGFQTNSYSHELMLQELVSDIGRSQFHERVSWVRPADGDNVRGDEPLLLRDASDPASLGELFFDIYDKILDFERMAHLTRIAMSSQNALAEMQSMSVVHYTRGTVAQLLKHIRKRVRFSDINWNQAVEFFTTMAKNDRRRMVGMNFIQELYLQLHMHGLYTMAFLGYDWRKVPEIRHPPPPKIFRSWSHVPPVVCLALSVPRSALHPLLDSTLQGSPILQMQLTTPEGDCNTFAALHGMPGKIVPATEYPVLQDREASFQDATSFVFCCWVPTWLLTLPRTRVNLVIQSTPQAMMALLPRLGMMLSLYAVPLTDADSVQVLRSPPGIPSDFELRDNIRPGSVSLSNAVTDVCILGKQIRSFSRRLDNMSQDAKAVLSQRAAVSCEQVGPCTIEVSIGRFKHTAAFPFPVVGTRCKLRIARTSGYVEVTVPPSGPFPPGGYHLNPFPVRSGRSPAPWGLHAINLDVMPTIDVSDAKRHLQWLNPHVALQMSDRERALRDSDSGASDALMNIKDSIHVLFMRFTGLQGGQAIRVYGLTDPDRLGMHTIVFVNKLRLDLPAFTVVLDAAVIPLDRDLMPRLKTGLQALTNRGGLCNVVTRGVEAELWRKYLPAAVERCRTWGHKESCEYKDTRPGETSIPLSTQVDQPCICSCGRGVDLESFKAMDAMPSWRYLRPYATRAAIGPLFAVSYVEPVASRLSGLVKKMQEGLVGPGATASPVSDTREKCKACGGAGKPTLLVCGRCKATKYCSAACQRADWKEHKQVCHAGLK
ncbi:hypothetical protein GLOTRDRAFT_128016 [Gloeophyllum trabeum ATCC 11539]|uniref:MYND-type domain-containing protein n=1 Tax=Gloeophyllum trabeum (strain ATCC 11539 / FP-39264 / Madison 617) TaxID=670483 RepID=S7RWG1_GLOTA|nr:uncharacterized protein GLOTRDRAFT_128016 [Gloeophyllum trabeum ATCC 11539]EPQ57659.1 hypothetical protein GLOTRDRAFT_128016 [Gloeophyllum trabeum ATCC 11539]